MGNLMHKSWKCRIAATATVLLATTAAPVAAQQGPTSIEFTTLLATDAAHAGTPIVAAVRARLDPGYHVNSDTPLDDYLIPTAVTVEPPAGVTLARLAYPEAEILLQAEVLELAVFGTEFVIGIELALAPDLVTGDYVIPATLHYQSCDAIMCYAPTSEDFEVRFTVVAADQPLEPSNTTVFAGMVFGDPSGDAQPRRPITDVAVSEDGDDASLVERLDDFVVLGTAGGYLPADDFMAFITAAETGTVVGGFFDDRGPIAILFLILIGGLALNLTPCVLPMVPINLAIIGAGSHASSRGRGFALGGAYGLAMALVYGVLGLVVILTAGTFGTINASPWFNLAIMALFVVLALAMFDIVNIDLSRFQSKLHLGDSGKGSLLLPFAMGGVSALLAGACVAPVVIQVIVFSSNLYATGTTAALALPFLLGVGMALPWPIAGAGLTVMPKPGAWMVRVKQAFGVFILATAAYYGYLAYELFAQRWVDPNEVSGSVEELVKDGWYTSLSQGLAAAESEGKPLLVDMWATWCKNCLTMDKTTLQDPEVKAALDGYIKVKFRAEDLNASPAKEVAKRFKAIGLPAYAIVSTKDAAAIGGGDASR